MKNNSKNRKLNFIRHKNGLRLGKNVYNQVFKISRKLNKDDIENIIKDVLLTMNEDVYKKYKIKLRNVFIHTGYIDDDFINNAITFKITLSNRL